MAVEKGRMTLCIVPYYQPVMRGNLLHHRDVEVLGVCLGARLGDISVTLDKTKLGDPGRRYVLVKYPHGLLGSHCKYFKSGRQATGLERRICICQKRTHNYRANSIRAMPPSCAPSPGNFLVFVCFWFALDSSPSSSPFLMSGLVMSERNNK
jgi:hypothetical protein